MSFFGRKLSIKGVPVAQATDKQLILKEDYDQGYTIYYDVNGVPSVLLGNRVANTSNGIGTTQRGLYVSQAGIDVTTATNSQLVFNSGQDVFKIIFSGTLTVGPVGAGSVNNNAVNTGIKAVSGKLNLIQAFSLDSGGVLYPAPQFFHGSYSTVIETYINTGNIWVTAAVFDESGTGLATSTTFKYYLLQETFS